MVAKISHGTSLYGALAYNYDKVTAGTAEILSGNRMISDRLGLPSEDIRLALLSFENYLLANRNTEKPVLHISLSPAPEDRLTDGQLVELAERYMQKMGYGNQPYIAYKHADTHNAHIHIVSVCVDGQGKKISDAYEHRRSMTACRELETDFGLRNGADTERRNPKAELKKVDASLGDVRHQVGNTLKAVLESYRFQTFGEYNALLSTLNIEAKQVRGEYNGIPYTGIVYSVTDDTGKVVSPPFKSSRFGKRFGNEQLEKRMLMNLKDLKDGKWAPSIQADIVRALRQADSRKRFVELLGQKNIDVVFRENERGRIYGVTFIDHNRREVFNGSRMGKEFSANVFNDYFQWLENIPEKERGGHSATELRQHHRHESGSTLELAAGILSMETNPRDYEEEAYARRVKKKKKTGRKHGSLLYQVSTHLYTILMQQEDDLRALAKIMEFGRAVSIFLLVVHVYVYCYPSITAWNLNLAVMDRILVNFNNTTGIFNCILWSKLLAVLLLAVSCLGTHGVKGEKITWPKIYAALVAGGALVFLKW